MRRFQSLLHVVVASLCVAFFTGADWLQFRGNNRDGVVAGNFPTASLNEIAWTRDLEGRGLSGPIVIGNQVVITSSSGFRQDRLHVISFDARSGDTRWERQFWATGRTVCHQKMCVATPTPASDGKRIFAFYSSNDVACLDLDGNLLWFRGLTHDFPNASNSLGMASSPLVVGDTLVVQVESDAEAFAAGLDVETGLTRWQIDRPRKANWTSPAVLKGSDGDEDLVLLQSTAGLSAVHPKTGDVAWNYDEAPSTISSPVAVGKTVYAPGGGLTALSVASVNSPPRALWQAKRLSPATPSALVYRDKIFTVNRSGVVSCANAEDGELAWRLRLQGPFSATPVAAGGLIYFFSEKGVAQVVKPGEKEGEIVNTVELGDSILCTPAIADGALYVRSDQHLWKFAD